MGTGSPQPPASLLNRLRSRIAGFISPSTSSPAAVPAPQASGTGMPYDAGASGRRTYGWNPGRLLGPTTSLWSSLDLMRARARDQIRNNPDAASAIDNFESQTIANGIRPRWNIADTELKSEIERKFNKWARSKQCDHAGLLSFYGLQALVSREMFEAGEVLCRFWVRPPSWKMKVPLQLQLIEAEQLPIYRNIISGGSDGSVVMPRDNTVRTGIEFDPYGRRVAYQMYKQNPAETMFYPLEALTFMRVSAEDMLHVYKPLRAGQLRGQPFLASVLGTLWELEQYTDASLVKRKIQTMFAAFIEKLSPDSGDIIPPDPNATPVSGPPGNPQSIDPGTENVKIETGTLQVLFPGEKVIFPQLPQDNDYTAFMRVMMHRFAVAIGATYEQITGDLKGVNYSSIRAGLIDFRRKCEQLQRNIIITQFCEPVVCRWLYEAVMSGELVLPGYVDDPSVYEDINWSLPAWAWVDPLKDVQASQIAVRAGFTSREAVVSEQGEEVEAVDAQTVSSNKRADEWGLVHDTDPRKVLVGRESNPDLATPSEPEGKEGEEAEEEEDVTEEEQQTTRAS